MVILAYWLGTRGQMMSIRAVATGASDVGTGWRETQRPAARLFKFHMLVGLLMMGLFLPVLGGTAVITVPLIKSHAEPLVIVPVLLGAGILCLLMAIPFMLLGAMARNFVAPVMLKHDLGARDAWKKFWSVGRAHVGPIIVFFLLRGLVAGLASLVALMAGVLTCCVGLLPVIHQTIMAPYYVFERAWGLNVLASLGPDFDLIGGAGAAGAPPGFGGGYGPPGPPDYGGHGGYAAPPMPPPGGFGRQV